MGRKETLRELVEYVLNLAEESAVYAVYTSAMSAGDSHTLSEIRRAITFMISVYKNPYEVAKKLSDISDTLAPLDVFIKLKRLPGWGYKRALIISQRLGM